MALLTDFGNEVLVLGLPDGAELARLDFFRPHHGTDMEAFTLGEVPVIAVINREDQYYQYTYLTVCEVASGRKLAGRELRPALDPDDLGIVTTKGSAPPRLAVLGERISGRGVRVRLFELDELGPKPMRFGRRLQALDLEIVHEGPQDPLLSVLLGGGSESAPRVVTRRANDGEKVSSVAFPRTTRPLDLTILPPSSGSPLGTRVLLGRVGCADGGFGVTLRDLKTGELERCLELPAGSGDQLAAGPPK